ncbi:fimbrial protein [Kluyvera sichuanensis]|uniref:fimbrial protein n=1 Tax=Kluyvera sichuanensis TaxID=2725494 RepID=UPI0039F45B29
MMKKLLKQTYYLFFAGIMLLVFSGRASADSVVLNFTGTILAGVCSVDLGSQNQSVPMGTISSQNFVNPGDRSSVAPFSITLNCPDGSVTGATVTFSGTPDTTDQTLLALDNETGMASGVAILLADQNGNKINLGTASSVYSLTQGASNALQFTAQYTALVGGDSITVGTANATAQFVINYP